MSGIKTLTLGREPGNSKDRPLYSWCKVWENFLDEDADRGFYLIRKLVPELPEGIKLDRILTMCGPDNKGNPFIVFYLTPAKKLVVELVREYKDWVLSSVVTRAFHYADTAEANFEVKDAECKMMPDIYLIDIQGVLPEDNARELRLVSVNGVHDVAVFKVPLVRVSTAMPLLDGLQECTDLVEVRHRVRQLYRDLGGAPGYGSANAKLFNRCAALADHRLYVDGARHSFVELVTASDTRLSADALRTPLDRSLE